MSISENSPRILDYDKDMAHFIPKQMEAIRALDSGRIKFLLYGGALGGGKLLDVRTVIPTPSGWTTMGELSVGKIVFADDGMPCKVTKTSKIEFEDTYKITFSDGAQIVAGGRHEWVTQTLAERHRCLQGTDKWREERREKRPSRVTGNKSAIFVKSITNRNKLNPPKIQDIPTSGIRTTKEILETLYSGVSINHSVSVANPIDLPERNLLIDPYVLGAWLGDGCSTAGQITGLDDDIFNFIKQAGYTVTDHANIKSKGILGLKVQLKKIGVYDNKHIPPEYLRASISQRLSLLQGLMDTDGHCDNRGQCEILLVNKPLIDGIHELICSLGIKVQMRTGRARLYGKDCGEKHRLKFLTNLQVFRLQRKLIRQKREGFRGTHDRRYIVAVEPVERVPLKCIQVDSPSHTYLCGREMIPTHNSYLLRWYAPRRLMHLQQTYKISQPVAMMACEDYPTLKDRQIVKIGREFPPWLGRMHDDHKLYGRCFIMHERWGSGVICFRNLDDPSKYQSAEFALIEVDELTKNPYDVFTNLRMRLRWPNVPDFECQFVAGTNPGGIGHGYCKMLWMDKIFPDEWINPIDYRSQFAYIPSLADDNPHLDPGYWQMLNTLPEAIRKAFRYGDWNVFLGQAFPEFLPHIGGHLIKPIPIPQSAPLYMTYDWGFGKPFSIGWWWVDNEGRIYRFAEWYGFNGNADQGLRLADSDVAAGIVEREEKPGIDKGRYICRISNPDSFAKRADTRGGGQGPSTAEIFQHPPYNLSLIMGDPNRKLKIRQFRERLKFPEDGQRPMMLIYDTCEQFIRTITNLSLDKNNIEDVNTKEEDHCYDEAALMCMARPISQPDMENPIFSSAKIIDKIEAKGDSYNDRYEQELMKDFMDDSDLYGYGYQRNEYDTGVNYDTI